MLGKCISRIRCSFEGFPIAINGISLCNGNVNMNESRKYISDCRCYNITVGIAVLILRLFGNFYGFIASPELWVFIGIFSFMSTSTVLIYTFRVILDPLGCYKSDCSIPQKLSAIGAFAMAVCLLAVILDESNAPFALVLTISLIGSSVQALSMLRFFVQIFRLKSVPEPYFNAAIHSCLFPVVSIPGDHLSLIIIRDIFLIFGLVTLLPSLSIQMWYLTLDLFNKDPTKKVLANNPSVAILQSPSCIALTAWLLHPLTTSSISDTGLAITHILFILSTFFYIITWALVLQRRSMFLSLGDDPSWSGATFPFCNTAIATNVYQMRVGHLFTNEGRLVLSIWVIIISIIAALIILYVNFMYARNYWFLYKQPISQLILVEKPLQEQKTDVREQGCENADGDQCICITLASSSDPSSSLNSYPPDSPADNTVAV